MDFIAHLSHTMATFKEITSVTFGYGEAAMTVELREPTDLAPKGWVSYDHNGTQEQFVAFDRPLENFQTLLRNAKLQAESKTQHLETLTREFDG